MSLAGPALTLFSVARHPLAPAVSYRVAVRADRVHYERLGCVRSDRDWPDRWGCKHGHVRPGGYMSRIMSNQRRDIVPAVPRRRAARRGPEAESKKRDGQSRSPPAVRPADARACDRARSRRRAVAARLKALRQNPRLLLPRPRSLRLAPHGIQRAEQPCPPHRRSGRHGIFVPAHARAQHSYGCFGSGGNGHQALCASTLSRFFPNRASGLSRSTLTLGAQASASHGSSGDWERQLVCRLNASVRLRPTPDGCEPT